MNNLFADAFKNAGIEFEEVHMTEEEILEQEKQYEINKLIKMYEQWLKMLERNVSDKERHNFVVKHGFLSVKQFTLWVNSECEWNDLQTELEERECISISKKEKKQLEKRIEEIKNFADNIKTPFYYRQMLRITKTKDITPYSEDILKSYSKSILNSDTRVIDVDSYIRYRL